MSVSINARELQVLAEIPRGDRAKLKVALDEFTGTDGKVSRFVSVRLWYAKDESGGVSWYPTRKGVAIRLGEIKAVCAALEALGDEQKPAPTGNFSGRFCPPERQRTTGHHGRG